MYTHNLRLKYKPAHIRVLMIGESPPNGGTFFFAGDSKLFFATKAAFENLLEEKFSDPISFLEKFRALGFYLEDICAYPVNKIPKPERRKACRAGIPDLAKVLRLMRPAAIIIVMKEIVGSVGKAIQLAELATVPTYSLPFPAYHHVRAYETELLSALRELRAKGVIGNAC